jgi:hypothetical protein
MMYVRPSGGSAKRTPFGGAERAVGTAGLAHTKRCEYSEACAPYLRTCDKLA